MNNMLTHINTCGITFVATNDNILFPFSTDFLVLHPINIIIKYTIGFGLYNGFTVIKVGLSSSDIQIYMFMISGYTLAPLCHYKEETQSESEGSVNVSDIDFKGDDLDILDNDEEFSDFDNFVKSYNEMSNS